jgi:hypothetical protein
MFEKGFGNVGPAAGRAAGRSTAAVTGARRAAGEPLPKPFSDRMLSTQ